MLHAAFARSPIARGKIVSVDLAAAREVPGVHAIYTMQDLAAVPFRRDRARGAVAISRPRPMCSPVI